MAIKKTIIVDANTKKAIKNVDNLTDSFEELEDQIEDTGDEVKQTGKDIGDGMETGAGGVRSLTVGIKSMGVALKAAGIGLIVGALAQFQSLFIGDRVGDTMTVVAESLRGIFQGMHPEDAVARAKEIVKVGKDLQRNEKDLQILQLEAQELAEKQRQIRDDVSISVDKRILANIELGAILQDQLSTELVRAEFAENEAEKRHKENKNNLEFELAYLDAKIKTAEISERITSQESEQKVNAVALQQEQNQLLETEAFLRTKVFKVVDDAELVRIQRQKNELEEAVRFQTGLLDIRLDGLEKGTQAYADALLERQDLEEGFSIESQRIDIALYNEKKRIVLDFADALQTVLGETSVAAKALAIAQATWNVYEGITKALTLPFPASLLAAATVGLTGFAAVKDIVDTPNPMGGNSGASGSAPTLPDLAPEFNIVGNTGVNQLAESISQQQNVPIKAFVVGKDVTTQQEMDRAIVNTATFG